MDGVRPLNAVKGRGTAAGPAPKRRKISLACSACRERKVRCDGEKPVCGCCRRRRPELRTACIYEQRGQDGLTDLSKQNQSVDDLLDRINHLERQLATIASNQPDTLSHSQPQFQYSPRFPPLQNHFQRRVEDDDGAQEHPGTPSGSQNFIQNGFHTANQSSANVSSIRQSSYQQTSQDATNVQFSVTYVPENIGQPSLQTQSSEDPELHYREQRTPATLQASAFNSTGIVSDRPRRGEVQKGMEYSSATGPGIAVITNLGDSAEGMTPQQQLTSTDAMGAMSADAETSPEGQGNSYYGRSSTLSFMQELRGAVPSSQAGDANQSPSFQSDTNLTGTNSSDRRRPRKSFLDLDLRFEAPPVHFEDFVLPPRSMADHLIQCYWDHVYSLYPYVHKPTFDAAYGLLWVSHSNMDALPHVADAGLGNAINADPKSRLFHCALNSIFALGCQFSDIPEIDRRNTSNSFLRRALTLLQVDLMESGCIALVQTLLLLAQYLQCTTFPNRCWNLVGMACRVAQGLGLHVEIRRQRQPGLELEMRRRVWYGCLILDMVLSMTLGRPMMILNDYSVPLPSAIDDQYLNISGYTPQPAGFFSQTTFYLEAIKLYTILGKILSQTYKPSNLASGSSTPVHKPHEPSRDLSGFDIVVEIDNSLTEFYTKLPLKLQWPKDGGSMGPPEEILPPVIEKQKNVLHARFLHLRILLYRPIFARFCQISASVPNGLERTSISEPPASEDSLVQHFFQARCSASCIRAAMELITLIHTSCRTKATGAWWYNVFYTYTAGVVVIMAMLCRPLHDTFGTDILENSWKECQETLMSMTLLGPNPQQCLESLHSLYSRVTSREREMTRNMNPNQPSNTTDQRTQNVEIAENTTFSERSNTDPANMAVGANVGYTGPTGEDQDQHNTFLVGDSEIPPWLLDIEDFWTGPTFDLFSEHTQFT